MDSQNTEGNGAGAPQAPAPAPQGDDDIKISNTGQRIRAILVVLIALGAAGAAIWWFNNKAKQEEAIADVEKAFQAVHAHGYEAFWGETQIDLKELKNNEDLELKVKEILAGAPVAYSKHIKEKAIPVLEGKIPDYKNLEAPLGAEAEVLALSTAAEHLLTAWKDFTKEVDQYETYLEAKAVLDESGNAWLGHQGDKEKEEFKIKAVNYLNLIRCILVDKVAFEIEPQDLQYRVQDTCAKVAEQSAWFRRAMTECMPKLLAKKAEPDEYFTNTVEIYTKEGPGDTSSVFGVQKCLDISKETFESEIIMEIAKGWAEYVNAQNDLAKKIKEKKDELK